MCPDPFLRIQISKSSLLLSRTAQCLIFCSIFWVLRAYSPPSRLFAFPLNIRTNGLEGCSQVHYQSVNYLSPSLVQVRHRHMAVCWPKLFNGLMTDAFDVHWGSAACSTNVCACAWV
ncbi:hypothetical protein EDB84DRAFT_550594 [Lactarius hengduanensis]|nr:hypothetical protein EDB84DRAFT_550594 [Lactarius hengduanensis]